MLDAMFLSDRQQDATEFLLRLLDLFREQFHSSKTDFGLQGWCFLVCQVLLLIPCLLQALNSGKDWRMLGDVRGSAGGMS